MVSEIKNEHGFDEFLTRMSQRVTPKERSTINHAGMRVFKKKLEANIREHSGRKESNTKRREKMISTLTTKTEPGGRVLIGFSKKGKKAYLARFMNDGWDSKNQYGGPYTHQPGEHYWENTEGESKESVGKIMQSKTKEMMKRRSLR